MQSLPRFRPALLLAGLFLFGLLPSQLPAQSPPSPPPPLHAAPSIMLPEGTVLTSGHVLGGQTTIQPIPGDAIVRFEDGSDETWSVEVAEGETRVYRPGHILVAQAEYVARERDGRPSCFIYQMHIAPEWIGMPSNAAASGQPNIATADDRVYSFREAPCP